MITLFITHHYLSSNGGGSFASRAYINAFAELSDQMTLLYPVKEGENLFDDINPKVEAIPVAYNVSKIKKLIHLLVGKVHRYFDVAKKISKERHFDVVVFDTSVVSFKLIDLFKKCGSKVIVIHHNYQYEYFRDNTSWWLKIPTLYWCKRYEGEAVRKADLNLTLTRQDIDLLSENYCDGRKDNLMLLGTFEYKSQGKRILNENVQNEYRFVITGNLGAVQTELSLIAWLNNCYPVLKKVFPYSTLTIAGKNPGRAMRLLCREKNITLIPSPETMDPIMENADYYICPICFGGGIKLRVMDGLKWGLPVIAHVVSARGYDAFVAKGCMFSYNDSAGFFDALVSLKNNNMNKQEVCNEYYDIFSFKSGVGKLKSIIDTMEVSYKSIVL